MTWVAKPCAKCGGPSYGAIKTRLCAKCCPRSREGVKAMHESLKDWASDPCHLCGKWPLSINNKTGYCRTCSRSRIKLYPDKRRNHARKEALDAVA